MYTLESRTGKHMLVWHGVHPPQPAPTCWFVSSALSSALVGTHRQAHQVAAKLPSLCLCMCFSPFLSFAPLGERLGLSASTTHCCVFGCCQSRPWRLLAATYPNRVGLLLAQIQLLHRFNIIYVWRAVVETVSEQHETFLLYGEISMSRQFRSCSMNRRHCCIFSFGFGCIFSFGRCTFTFSFGGGSFSFGRRT